MRSGLRIALLGIGLGLLATMPVGADRNAGENDTNDSATTSRSRQLAEQGNAAAQYILGWMYDEGMDVPQDHVEAAKWYRLAARQGDAMAQFSLGMMYAEGRGVLQDRDEAVKWWRLAAEQGHERAQSNLGLVYAKGGAVPEKSTVLNEARERARQEKAERLRAGRVFRDCADCPEMVVIPAGRFRMGDLNGGGSRDEEPVHEVRIAQPFAMGRYEVTFAEYDRYAQATGKERPDDEGWGRGNHPVINVSWQDAQGYVKWLSQETDQRYRLPSEAEWEYAARAGSTTKYYWGNSPSGRHANADEDDDWPSDGYERTAPTGSFIPNQFGLCDMSGNVWEWVEDCRRDNYRRAPTDGSVWARSRGCNLRVLRGGSFVSEPALLRSAVRGRFKAASRGMSIGFRLVRML